MSARALVLLVPLVGCGGKPPPDAPQELGDLGLFLFAHFEDEDPAEEAAGLLNLAAILRGEDLTLEPKEKAVTMPVLEGDNLGGLSIPAGILAADQIPVAIAGRSTFPVDRQTETIVDPNQTCIESSSTVWAEREFLTDPDCFADGSCDRLDVSQAVRKESIIADVWIDPQYKDYRWFDLEDEEGNVTRAILGRSWFDKVMLSDSGGNSWDQLFHLDAFIEDPEEPGTTLRWFSMWSSVTLNLVGDDVYRDLVVSGIGEALVYGDEYIAGNIESCKNDRDGERPE